MRYLISLCVLLMVFNDALYAQSPHTKKVTLTGYVTDSAKHPASYANVSLLQQGKVVAVTITDEDGCYILRAIPEGVYDIKCTLLGYINQDITQKKLSGREVVLNIVMEMSKGTDLKEVYVKQKKSLVEPCGKGGGSFSSRDLMARPSRSVNSAVGVVGGRSGGMGSGNGSSGSTPNIRGSRADGTAYYVDGIRVTGGTGLPMSAATYPSSEPNTERYGHIAENEFKSTKSDPLSTFSIDVDKASYAIVRSHLNDHDLPPADAVRVEEMINYFQYDAVNTDKTHPFNVKAELCVSPWNKEHKLVRVALNAPELIQEEAPPSNLVFLIDVSGSMQDQDKLPLLKDCMKLLVDQLKPHDRISMVVYAGREGLVLNGTKGSNKAEILQALETLNAGGSTAGGAGIQLAYNIAEENFIKKGNNRIILATDGDFNVGITSIPDLTQLIEKKRESGVFLSVLGFGKGNLKDETMELLADKGNGNYNYIDNILEGKKVLVKEMGGTLFTVAKDVKIQVEFNPNYVKSYRLIGYENRLLNAEDFNDDKKDAGEIGAGHHVTALYELVLKEDKHKARVDDLKYQQQVLTDAASGNELMNIKVRYKKPEDTTSIKFEVPVYNQETAFAQASEDMRFAVSVAVFGMKLRNSPYVKNISYDTIISMSKDAKGKDEEGYRSEFIRLVETAQLIASR